MELTRVSLQVDMAVIRAYAELTQDFNPIHLDREMAEATPMGGVIAHGTLSICLLWQSVFASLGERALGEGVDLDVRFLKPVREGETLCAGGRSFAGDPDRFEVWVRGDDDSDRVAGTLQLPALQSAST
jgi:3-hydroxybutyryl-CoA dehydratase